MKFDNNDQRRAFMRLPRDEQLETLHDMVAYLRNEQAEYVKQHIDLRDELKFLRNEMNGIGMRTKDDTLTTTEKFDKLMGKRFDWGVWLRDKVLPGVISFITMGLLYLVFGGKLP